MVADEKRKKNSRKKRYFRIGTIAVRSHRYGTLKLDGFSLGSAAVLQELLNTDISAREFTIRAISYHLSSPELAIDTLRAASDKFLARVAAVWAEHEDGLGNSLSEGKPPFDAFKQAVRETLTEYYQRQSALFSEFSQSIPKITLPSIDTSTLSSSFVSSALDGIKLDTSWMNRLIDHFEWADHLKISTSLITSNWLADMKSSFIPSPLENFRAVSDILRDISIQPVLDSIWESAGGFAGITEQITQSLQEIVGSLQPTFNIGNILQGLPGPMELIRQWEETRRAEEALEMSGYGFSAHLWEAAFVIGFAKVSVRVRSASVTNKLLAMTRSNEFAEALRSTMQSSPTLMRRQRVIQRALEAHRQRDYIRHYQDSHVLSAAI